MAHNVTVVCSRCRALVEGTRGVSFTSGFYDVARGYWKIFGRPGERRLCDLCMFSSPEYQYVYGVVPGYADKRDTPRGRMVAQKLKVGSGDTLRPDDTFKIFGPNGSVQVKSKGETK